MTTLNDVKLPDTGLALIFSPSDPGNYAAEVRFSPGALELEDIKFYMALGQGLIYLASNQTDDVLKIGAQIIMANQPVDAEPEAISVENSDIPAEIAEVPVTNVVDFASKKKSK